jgi:hypothetical protein
LVFRGTMRALCNRGGLMSYLWAVQVRLTEFAELVLKLTEQLKDASLSLARQSGRPVQYQTSAASNKEDIARGIAAADHIEQGLICVLFRDSSDGRSATLADGRSDWPTVGLAQPLV